MKKVQKPPWSSACLLTSNFTVRPHDGTVILRTEGKCVLKSTEIVIYYLGDLISEVTKYTGILLYAYLFQKPLILII